MNALYLTTYLVLWALVLIQMVALAALYHHFGALQMNSREGRAAQGPAIGSPAHLHRLGVVGTLDERTVAMSDVREPLLLIFASTTCQPCRALRDELARFIGDGIPLMVFCDGPDARATAEWSAPLMERGISVVHDARQQIAARLGIAVTPFLVGVDSSGVVRAKGIVNDLSTVLKFAAVVKQENNSNAMRDGLRAVDERAEVSNA